MKERRAAQKEQQAKGATRAAAADTTPRPAAQVPHHHTRSSTKPSGSQFSELLLFVCCQAKQADRSARDARVRTHACPEPTTGRNISKFICIRSCSTSSIGNAVFVPSKLEKLSLRFARLSCAAGLGMLRVAFAVLLIFKSTFRHRVFLQFRGRLRGNRRYQKDVKFCNMALSWLF